MERLWSLLRKAADAVAESSTHREHAALIWLAIFIVGCLIAPNVRRAMGALAAAFFAPILVRINLLMTSWVAASVAVLGKLELWTLENLKTTIVWWLTFAFISMMDLRHSWDEPKAAAKAQLRELVSATVIITFLVEAYSFPLWAELLLLPATLFFVAIRTVAERDPAHTVVRKAADWILACIGFAMLGHSVLAAFGDMEKFVSLTNLREFTTPLLLSVFYLPFLYGLGCYRIYETVRMRIGWRIENPKLERYAAFRVLCAFGFDADMMRRWNRYLSWNKIGERSDVDRSINHLRALRDRERYPAGVYFEDGWSPYAAKDFLAEEGLTTGDWHRRWGDDWGASGKALEIEGRGWRNKITYEVAGTEYIATTLRLTLYMNSPEDEVACERAHEIFGRATGTLLRKALGDELAEAATTAIADGRSVDREGALYLVSLSEEPRGVDDKCRDLILAVTHRRHVDPFAEFDDG